MRLSPWTANTSLSLSILAPPPPPRMREHYIYTVFSLRAQGPKHSLPGVNVKSSNFVTGSKFCHPSSEFLWSSAKFILKDIKKFKNTISFKYFSLLMLLHAKIGVIWCFLKFWTWSLFVTKLNLKTSKNLPKNINKEASYMTAIHMKYSSKSRKEELYFNNLIFFSL